MTSMPARPQAFCSRPSSSSPLRPGGMCSRGRECPRPVHLKSSSNGTPWRSVSQSRVGPDSRAMRRANAGSARPSVLAMTSATNDSGSSSTPAARCAAVPTPQTAPSDIEVLPQGRASRSSTSTSRPSSRAASAAVSPHAPAPTTATSMLNSNLGMCSRMMPMSLSLRRRDARQMASKSSIGGGRRCRNARASAKLRPTLVARCARCPKLYT